MPRFPLLQLILFVAAAWNLALALYTDSTASQISFGTWFTCFVLVSLYHRIATKLDDMSWKTEAELRKLWEQNQKLISAAELNAKAKQATANH